MSEHDFDAFLRDINEKNERQTEAANYTRELEMRAETALAAYHTDRNFSFDPALDAQIRLVLIDIAKDVVTRHLEQSNIYDTSDDDIMAEAEELAIAAMMHERALVTRAMMLVVSHDQDLRQGNPQPEKDTDSKKQFMASLIVGYDIEPSDSFMTFVRHFVPGDDLDISAEADAHYLVEAIEATAHSEADRQQVGEYLYRAKAILRTSDSSAQRDENLVADLYIERQRYRITAKSEALYRAYFDEVIRDAAIPAEQAEQLFRLLHEYVDLPPAQD